jgi:hypothetical protein
MKEMNGNNGNGSDAGLAALLKREAELKEKIAAAKAAQQKREAQCRKRLAEIIGGALLDGDLSPDLKSSISQILAGAGLEDRAKRLLQERGWL